MRKIIRDAIAIRTSRQYIMAEPGQKFYETTKGIELWQEQPLLRRIKRWNRRSVLWVTTSDPVTTAKAEAEQAITDPVGSACSDTASH